MATICVTLGREICDLYIAQSEWPAVSQKTWEHWFQNAKTQRFQEFVEDWAYPDTYEAPLYPVEEISEMPISLLIAELDETCSA